jgi:hypothetical protein
MSLPTSPGNPPGSTDRITHLFARLYAFYGQKWLDQYGAGDMAMVKATWARGTADLLDAEIAAGLDALLRRGVPFPPTLPEFRAACQPPAPKIPVPTVEDHRGLERLAGQLGVPYMDAPSYAVVRSRIISALAEAGRLPDRLRLTDES